MWKQIEEADENVYVSDMGDISHNGKLLKYRLTKHGYARVHYKVHGKFVDRYVHRIVAIAFLDNPNHYPAVNHIDGNKLNNQLSNLEWCTYKMNMIHASQNHLINTNSTKRKEQCKLNQLKSLEVICKPCVEYDEHGQFIAIHSVYKHNCLHRLSYKNHYYFDMQILTQQYNDVPTYIDIGYLQAVQNKHRHRYFQYQGTQLIRTYQTIADLPISREELYFCYKHKIVDSMGYRWHIQTL